MDSTVWVAILTGATAVLAGWVTSLGNARAARIQAEASAYAQHHERLRESRRAAYLEFIGQAHIVGEHYFRLGDVYMQVKDPAVQEARIQDLRKTLRDAFDPLARCARVVQLEGPAAVAELAGAVQQAAADCNSALWEIAQGNAAARERFDGANRRYRSEVERFIYRAREAMGTP
ncbi:hypothetical protein [Spongiactinospora sp. TRM90649]|uniref:hypothetical protein n=1 Tax=Spongiactinospora sp. TRM90649 TaxID=3031114 RepID=UPI0023F71001|nr:hypothetical protein [Spongiactinospora sp. TRM90649]MDF5755809.1 hypothetical protein [Spongiactinospora sp. TRM90649]